jgi:uncharacterized protein YozE (UPF0346 family)
MRTFYDWLKEFKEVNLPIGDLAGDVLRDKTFPKDVDSLTDLMTHLDKLRAHEDALFTAQRVWRMYEIDEMNVRSFV